MQALYFMAGCLVTSGVLMQVDGGPAGWGAAIFGGLAVACGAAIADYFA